MVGFLRWAKSITLGVLNGIVKFAVFLALVFVVLLAIGLARGDGLPGNMVLGLDLRTPLRDSSADGAFPFNEHPLTVMDIVLALDRAGRDPRVKGVVMRVGNGDISIAQAEEIGAALQLFRKTGKFVTAYAQGFNSSSLGDYLAAANANEIWMQPHSVFSTSGAGAGAVFLRGLFDKIDAVPQIAKRSDYKSAADMFMEKGYTPADREQTTALLQSWYGSATRDAASDRRISEKAVDAAFQASPQFAEDAQKAGMIDKIGYDDEADTSARTRAGSAKIVQMREYAHDTQEADRAVRGPEIALIEASGEIVDGTAGGGTFDGSTVIAGDDLARTIREAANDDDVKAIVLRVDSPGGSVTASDQILHAVKMAQKKGKPVIVSMGSVAASGGYYISASADKIIAQPGTITGSIGVLTGKVAIGKTLALAGITADEIGIGKNALFNSAISPYTPDQWAALNHQADVIYADFTHKVSEGRKLPIDKVQNIAKGRVWSGTDAHNQGLVDQLGGLWTAVAEAKKLSGIADSSQISLRTYPRPKSLTEVFDAMFSGSVAGARTLQALANVAQTPLFQAVLGTVSETPRGGVELRATNLPH
ncbi:MAG: signal peptide peptidase SppA [Proteobacteria bacterium]|nr:signal peptide peptidase SppA [Pseudomonadota bacterium]